MSWFKKYWGYLVAAVAAVIGVIIAILSLGRVRPKPPPIPKRPELKPVEIPDARPLDTTPADDYVEEKVEKVDDVAASINARYS